MRFFTVPFLIGVLMTADSTVWADIALTFNGVDFETGVIEIRNFSLDTDIDLTGFQFCSHSDGSGEFNYTSPTGFSGVTIEKGTSIFIWAKNDGPNDGAINFNAAALGGGFASDLDPGPYSIGLYNNGNFASKASLEAHIQWNIDGVPSSAADARNSVAAGDVWENASDWISTTPDTKRIQLIVSSINPGGSLPNTMLLSSTNFSVSAVPEPSLWMFGVVAAMFFLGSKCVMHTRLARTFAIQMQATDGVPKTSFRR